MTNRHINACRCGCEEEVEVNQQRVGAVWQCPACGEYTAHVWARNGTAQWVVLDTSYADWLGLYDEPEEEEAA